MADSSSWVAKNYKLFNIATMQCTAGVDEECSLDLLKSNQPTCPSQLGLQTPLTSAPVYNIQYPNAVRIPLS